MIDAPMAEPPPLTTQDRRGGGFESRPDRGPRRRWPGDHGLLVVGHGTADRVGAAEAGAVAALVAARLPGVPVELGFLEVIEPGIQAAVARLAARGCRTIVAAPLLLQTAGHARQDVPEALAAAAAHARVSVVQAESLGCHPALVALSRQRRRAAVLHLAEAASAATALVMVGRGASDPTTTAQLEAFTARSLADDPCPPAHVTQGFVAVARPRLADALAWAAGIPGVRRVVVQPHLLFRGHVEREVVAAVVRARSAAPQIEWVTTTRLGGGAAVCEALVDRALEAAAGSGASRA
jgi:sirohydrochlorin cobaltochelatase